MVDHRFGGAWTQIKLETVVYYLECFTNALGRGTNFQLWYIDAFAGTGSRTVEQVAGGLFQGQPLSIETATLAGSARRALSVTPAFDRLLFLEQEPERFSALRALASEYRDRKIDCMNADANVALRQLTMQSPWNKGSRGGARGVVFLDPYALQVEWATLKALAATECLDVWYLFPLRDVVRQLAHDYQGIGVKEPRLDIVLGPDWRKLYRDRRSDEALQLNLLSEPADGMKRDGDMRTVERWFKGRLDSIFAYVAEPLQVLNGPGRQAFSLFLCVSNPSGAAIKLAKQFAASAISSGSRRAFRHRSAP